MKIISTHSYRGGTGKTNIIANLSLILAEKGFNVGVVDTDVTTPGLHINYGLGDNQLYPTLTEFYLHKYDSEDIIHDISGLYPTKGKLYLIPSNLNQEIIEEIISHRSNRNSPNIEGDLGILFRLLKELSDKYDIDYFLLDNKPGFDDERTLLILSMSHILLIISRNDETDIKGTKDLLNIVDKFMIPEKYLIPNQINPERLNEIKKEFAKIFNNYDLQVSDPLPNSDKLRFEHSPSINRLFIDNFPEDPFSKSIMKLADKILKNSKSE